jgi:hypothetical protein
VIEIYGLSSSKLEVFDLLDAQNQLNINNWSDKQSIMDLNSIIKQSISDSNNIRDIIFKAQSAAHYAPTGKNPQSSRGHVIFIIETTVIYLHRIFHVFLPFCS